MATYVILDTSIYRQLGLKFQDNIDYKNFCGFLVATDNEMLISDIVIKEFVGYYSKHLGDKINTYNSSLMSLIRDPFFECDKLEVEDLSKYFNSAIKKFKKLINNDPNHGHRFAHLKTINLHTLELVDFIVESNNKGVKNIQVRDFLIWLSLLNFAKEEMNDRHEKIEDEKISFKACNVAFISGDVGFKENEIFLREKKKFGVTNLELYDSIPQFLNKYGYNVPFLTKELIKESITLEDITDGLKTDSGCFLSYISPRYHSNECSKRKIETFKVDDYEVIEFYSYKDGRKNKFVAHLKVFVNIIYASDENIEEFLAHKKSIDNSQYFYLETYDNQNRPIFNAPILYMISGELDFSKEKIQTKEMINFIPDQYI